MDVAHSDASPNYKAYIRLGLTEDDGTTWETPYEISITGPAAFVARMVASAADAFEEDAQR